ncbi:hypothetical protein QJS10_CPA01g01648 [Acorus calamus]|uniref:Uncharacterized protein n=1 Tax=Acorus calamus TaxID=4465 RepID=A0AAV9FS01_ACOCL|nr:hypothetical protein QJS10_CPA01g01648 [Acorus calamus]
MGKIVSAIGTPLCMDTATRMFTRISYARVYVEIEAGETLPDSICRKILPGYLIHNPTSSGRIWVCWQPQSVDLTLLMYSEQYVHCKAPGLSDHSVLQVVVKPRLSSGPRPFKYFQLWEDRTDFLNLVTTAWSYKVIGSPMFILAKKLQHLKIIIKKWNFEVFGPISTLSLCVARNSIRLRTL